MGKNKRKTICIFIGKTEYGIFSVNPYEIETVVKYINNQQEHHKKHSFENELTAFLNKYEVEYDEKYLWD
ncbi:MAG: transposase [bacterium]